MYSMVLMAALTTGTSAPDTFFRHGCHGCHGCFGGCYGCYGGCHGCWGGCYGGCHGCWGGTYGYSGYGAHGCWGGYGDWFGSCSGYGQVVGVTQKSAKSRKAKPEADEDADEEMKEDQRVVGPSKARVIVELPEDAKLFIDDQPMKTTSARRVFTTPKLKTGETYYYILRAQVVRDGQPITRTKRIIVRPGQEVLASFPGLDEAEPANDE